jgi:hypothetical protein
VLTRYIGLSLVLAAAAAILLYLQVPWRRKIANLSIFTLVSLAPIALWTLRNKTLTGAFNNRALEWHPPTTKNMVSAIHTVLAWFLPENLVYRNEKNFLIAGILGVFLVALFYLQYRNKNGSNFPLWRVDKNSRMVFGLHANYIFTYSIILIISKTLFDDNIGFTDRLLSPLLVSLLILLLSLLSSLWSVQFRPLRLAAGLLSTYLVVFFVIGAFSSVLNDHNRTCRYLWHEFEAIHPIQDFPGDVQ